MNREMKFRAYIKDGFLKGMHEVTSLFPRRKSLQCTFERYTFDEVELMQYTGLKDKNGVEIYEGDIVKYISPNEEDVDIYQVIFKEGSFLVENEYESYYMSLTFITGNRGVNYEVIRKYIRKFRVIR